jgi:glucose/arabinose dehydrogenase
MAAMKPMSPQAVAVALALLLAGAAHAADAAPPGAPAPKALPAPKTVPIDATLEASAVDDKVANEPVVKHTVIDDKHTHIEELRVRGQLQKVTVAPKDGAPGYEVITDAGSRDLTTGASNSRGATGQRVWNLFHF